MRCEVCGGGFEGNFCPWCGAPGGRYVPPRNVLMEGLRSLGSTIWLVSIAIYMMVLGACIALLIAGLGFIPSGILSEGWRIPLFFIVPQPLAFAVLSGYSYLAWFAFVSAALLASFIWLVVRSAGPMKVAVKLPIEKFRERLGSESTIAMGAQMFMAIMFFSALYSLVLWLANLTPSVPDVGEGSDWESVFLLGNAAVYEELITRILFMGVPLLIIDYARRRSVGAGDVPGYLLGGRFRMETRTVALLSFSSAMFALAHLPGWDILKVLPAYISGLALGYLYLKKGLFASIMLHFSFNYFAALAFIMGDNLGALVLLGLISLAMICVGSMYFVHYLLRIFAYLFPPAAKPGPTPPPVPQAPPVPPPRPFFVCPRCGYSEARYFEGRLECLRCRLIL